MTIAAYRCDMRALLSFTVQHFAMDDVRELRREHLQAYFVDLERRLKPYSRMRKLTSLRSLFRWLQASGHVPANIALLLGKPKTPRTLPKYLTPQEVRALMEAAEGSTLKAVRTRAILRLLYATGIRASELSHARLENLDVQHGLLKVMGKGRRERVVQFFDKARIAIAEWVRQRAEWYAMREWENRDKGWLFVNFRDGGRLTSPRIHAFVAQAGRDAGITRKVHPHLIRHSFATHRLANRVDIRVLQEMLGHTSLSTTAIYAHVEDARMTELWRSSRSPD